MEYTGKGDKAAESKQAAQNKKAAFTQAHLSHAPSPMIKERTKKVIAIKVSQMSAGLLSIKRTKGPSSQKI